MARWKTAVEREVVKCTITSKRTAEIYIKSWIERNKSSRERALKRLSQLGIEISGLPDESEKQTIKNNGSQKRENY